MNTFEKECMRPLGGLKIGLQHNALSSALGTIQVLRHCDFDILAHPTTLLADLTIITSLEHTFLVDGRNFLYCM